SDHAINPILVNTTVGLTLFVLMPRGPNSTAIVLVIWFKAPLDAQYDTWSGIALWNVKMLFFNCNHWNCINHEKCQG
ncbi:hypothetical protein OFM39_37125, partial [Escherichia coli]|nr:hypothetical protein [Escherichia coli]